MPFPEYPLKLEQYADIMLGHIDLATRPGPPDRPLSDDPAAGHARICYRVAADKWPYLACLRGKRARPEGPAHNRAYAWCQQVNEHENHEEHWGSVQYAPDPYFSTQ